MPDCAKGSVPYLDLGKVKNMARVRLNGKDLGTVWVYPWRVNISKAVKSKNNRLEIEVVNLWANRLIGDEQMPYDGISKGRWPDRQTPYKRQIYVRRAQSFQKKYSIIRIGFDRTGNNTF
jgi:hypothetical protein